MVHLTNLKGKHMETYTLARSGGGPVHFDGWEIASISTNADGKQRWTELTIYAVDSDNTPWVVQTIGRSIVDGEVDRCDAIPCKNKADVIHALSKRGRLTSPGQQLLAAAYESNNDHDFKDAFRPMFEGVEFL